MNDFLKAMGQFGMEGLGLDHEENVSLEQEMNEEIAMEAELDESYAQMDFANIVASTSQCEAILTAMAEREVGLESNEGRDAGEIYKEFGLEAVKDVAMRKVYSGFASLKALINTCINWLKQLLGIAVASKKVFSGIQKKAKAMNKQLGKVQVKVSEKLTRDMPSYGEALEKLGTYFAVFQSGGADNTLSDYKTATEDELNKNIKFMKDDMDKYSDMVDKLNETYDKSDTTEYEGSDCYNFIKKIIKYLESEGKAGKQLPDMQKQVDREIKSLEKFRKEIEKKDAKVTAVDALSKYINTRITYATKKSSLAKKSLKLYVRVADDALTMAKGIYATLV